MLRVYRYRLYPTRAQEATLHETLVRLRELYNAALQERRDAYRKFGVSVGCAAQQKAIKFVREVRPEYGAIHSHLMQDALTRLDRAYSAFFRRVKAGEKPGFPRFKGPGQYRTFTFKDAVNNNGVKLVAGGRRMRLAGVGKVKVRLHRPIEGRIKQVSVTFSGDGHWYVAFVCDQVPQKLLPPTGIDIGIDVGLKAFATFSDGSEAIPNPRHLDKAKRELTLASRRVSRRKRGSKRRRKAVRILARKHARVQRTRLDFHHKTALDIVRRADRIFAEDLNVKGLASGMLARSVHDAAWTQFLTTLASKAESAGREFYRVDPRGTTQTCSECGERVPKDLSVRTHACPHCGLVMDRDENAARNIVRLGRSRRGGVADGPADEPRSPLLAF